MSMPQPRRLFVHVGLQKTGTSYLQGVMLRNAELLARGGLDLVPASRRDAFELMLLVRDRYNPARDRPSGAGALERFSAELAAARGDRALLSQESLAAAKPEQVRRLLDACDDREVHVVITVRDLARQVPSSWQQELKSGRTDGYGRWLRRLQKGQRSGSGGHPWIQLDPPAVLERWRDLVPPERIHVVTVPPPGSPTTLLLERFCRVLEVDAASLVPEERASNTSLGRVQAEVLRRVNRELPDELRRRQVYGDVGKRFFASRVLAAQEGRRIRVPEELREWCESVTDDHIEKLSGAGYSVEGTLEDLRCRPESFSDTEAKPAEREIAAAAVSALVRILGLRAESVLRRRARQAGPDGVRGRITSRLRALAGRGGNRSSDWADDDEP
jgi:hypothetical protein